MPTSVEDSQEPVILVGQIGAPLEDSQEVAILVGQTPAPTPTGIEDSQEVAILVSPRQFATKSSNMRASRMKHIFGSWQDSQGNKAAKGQLHLKLNQDAVVPATSQAAPREVEFQLDSNGALGASAKIWANDELLPTGTYYILTVTAFGGGKIWGPQNVYIAGDDPIDLNLAIPLPGIAAIEPFASAGQSVVFTRPPLQAGVFGNTVSDLTTWYPNAFVTVSDQFVLAGASGISIIASKSLDSLTASIVASFDTESFPRFSAAALGSTVTNQLVLVGGSNVSLSNSTDSNGMTVNFNVSADIEITTNPLSLVAGSNISFIQSGNTAGTTITINASVGSVSLFAGSNITLSSALNSAGSSYTIAASGGGGGAISLVQGSNISLQSSTGLSGATYTINASNNIFSAGALGPIVTNQLMLEPGNNITLSTSTNAAGMTVSINGAVGGGTGAGAGVGIAAAGPGSVVGTPSGSTLITNTMMLVPANNITFYTNTDASNMSVFISGNPPAGSAAVVGAGGGALGNTGISLQPHQLILQAGPNITLSAQTDILSNLSVMISGASGGAGGSAFSAAIHSSLESITTLPGVTQFGSTLGLLGPNTLGLRLAAGPYITLVGATGTLTADQIVTIRANKPFSPVMQSSTAGGATGGSTFNAITNGLWLYAGSNITLSGASDTLGRGSMTIYGPTPATNTAALFRGGIDGGNTTGISGTVTNQLLLAGGPNITVSGSTDAAGMTVSLSGASGGGGGASFSAGISGGNTTGTTGTVSNQLVLAGGPNITLSGSTNAAGMTVSLSGASANPVFHAGISGGNTAGVTGTVSNQLVLAGGSNITLSGNTDVNGMSVTINQSPGTLALATGFNMPAGPMFQMASSWNTWGMSSISFWPYSQLLAGSGFTGVNFFASVSFGGAGSPAGVLSVSAGVYGRSGSLLSQLSSGSVTYTVNTAISSNVTGLKLITVPMTMSFSNWDNYMALAISYATGQSWTLSHLVAGPILSSMGAILGQPVTGSFQRIPGWGFYSNSSLPATLSFTDLQGQFANYAPVVYFGGFTA